MEKKSEIYIICDLCGESSFPYQKEEPEDWHFIHRDQYNLAVCPHCCVQALKKYDTEWKHRVTRFEFAQLEKKEKFLHRHADLGIQHLDILTFCDNRTMIEFQDHSIYQKLADFLCVDFWFHTERDMAIWTTVQDYQTIAIIGSAGIRILEKLITDQQSNEIKGSWTFFYFSTAEQALQFFAKQYQKG